MLALWPASNRSFPALGFLLPALLALSLSACERSGGGGDLYEQAKTSAPAAQASMERAIGGEAAPDADVAAPEKPQQPPQNGTPAGAVMLAYSYAMAIEAPLKSVPALAKAHEQACVAAGPQLCQVLGSSSQSYGADSLNAHLSLRAAPAWLTKFRAQIESDAKGANGRVRSNSVTSEDLTRSIVDTTAQLNAQKTLRGRLQELLASRPGKLSDLLEVERELARVQGEIDSQESELAVMRQRVNMSTLEIDYQSETLAVASGVFEPLVSAVKGVAGNVIAGLAAMVTIASALLPWLLVLVPAAFYGRRFFLKRQAAKAAAKAKAESV